MKITCPHCGKDFEILAENQSKGGKARWKGTKKADRSENARKAAEARWGKKDKR